jgi:hypothetical protein
MFYRLPLSRPVLPIRLLRRGGDCASITGLEASSFAQKRQTSLCFVDVGKTHSAYWCIPVLASPGNRITFLHPSMRYCWQSIQWGCSLSLMFQALNAHFVPFPEVLWFSTSFSGGLSSNNVGLKEFQESILVSRYLFRCCPKISLVGSAPLEALNPWQSSGLIPFSPQRLA